MLKINLLPIRQLKKRAQARKHILLLGLALSVSLLLFLFLGLHQANKIEELQASIANLKKLEQSYAPILARIKKLKEDSVELSRKTEVIDKLKEDSSLTVRVLDEVANSVDNNRIWLESLSQQGGTLQLSGIALDNRTISEFMDTLKKSPFVTNVDLTDTSMQTVSDRKLKKFSLNCTVAPPPKINTEEPKKS